MTVRRSLPSPANRYHVDHTERLRRTFHALTGRHLIDPVLSPDAAADALFHAPFVVLSHNADSDPILTYGNRAALELFALTWGELIQMPSRLTAEAPNRAERARLLAEVTTRGYIDDYSGVRIARTGQRFLIERATVLYRPIRVGQHDRPFTILKFLTMRVDAEREGARLAEPDDPRITRVGRLLRETRIDELPQWVNVLRGAMSLVGPRPERPEYVARLRATIPFHGLRHLGQPGLTGWARICYPYADSERRSREKLQYDLYDLKNASIGFDLLILLQTVHTILWGSGAR